MKKELKDKWVAALRSGEYMQCQEQLQKGNSFCCLGVLAEVGNLKHDGMSIIDSNGERLSYNPLIELVDDPNVKLCVLYNLNDSKNKTFPEIADWIEENVRETP